MCLISKWLLKCMSDKKNASHLDNDKGGNELFVATF